MKRITINQNMIHAGDLILVNRKHPIIKNEADTNLADMGNGILLEQRCAMQLRAVMDELSAWDDIIATSGWRSQREQEQLYAQSLRENGSEFTAQYVAVPGHSEHQLGLAVDLAQNQPEIDEIRPSFPYTGICGAFRKKAALYGFIERYPLGKEHITGIAHEPWHFRYVGAPHAMIMNLTGDTLEEHHERLKQCRNPLKFRVGGTKGEIFYIAAKSEITVFETKDDTEVSVSGNNHDGFIITAWKQAVISRYLYTPQKVLSEYKETGAVL